MKIRVIDFFCGCGGTSAGLKLSGMDVVAGIDIDDIALETFARNFPEAKTINQDIKSLAVKDIKKFMDKEGAPVLFSACAPCQPFSSQNKKKSSKDGRRSLLDALHPFIKGCLPDYILLENVPGLQKIKRGPFTRFTKLLSELGYSFDVEVKDAKNYGVPQTRRRLVLVASKHGEVSLPLETHGIAQDLQPYKTVWESIRRFHPLQAGQKSKNIANHQATKISELNIERLKNTPEGGDRRNWPEHLLLECHKKSDGYTDTYGRLSKNTHAPTLTTKCTSISNGRYGHPTQNRAISAREAAALQTFDDDFIFEGSLLQASRQVGNAVPVLFAKALGNAIIQQQGQR